MKTLGAINMKNWPLNGKSLWTSLAPGQKWSVFIGLPFAYGGNLLLAEIASFMPCRTLEVLVIFFGYFFSPYVYVVTIGIWIAAIIQVFFYENRF